MSESKSSFRGLVSWQKAQELAVAVLSEIDRLPRSKSVDLVSAQLARSVGSVAANIAEGYGRFSAGAYRNHLSIARGSLFETESWIDLLFRTGYVSSEANQRLIDGCAEVGRLLTAQMRTLTPEASHRVRENGSLYETTALWLVDGEQD